MDMRTFRAPSMAQALLEVKRGLGPDAVILHTRSVRTGGVLGIGGRSGVEVTAASRRAKTPAPRATASMTGTGSGPKPKAQAQPRAVAQPARPVRKPAAAPQAKAQGKSQAKTQPKAERRAEAKPQPQATRPAPTDVRTRALRAAHVEPAPEHERARAALHAELDAVRSMLRDVLDTRAAQAGVGGALPEPLARAYARLLDQDTDPSLAAEVIGRARDELSIGEMGDDQIVGDTLVRLLSARIAVAPTPPARAGRARRILLMGPTGVGKTTTIAKLAAQFAVRSRQRVGLLTCDTYRIAAAEQLRTYASIMDLPVEVVAKPADIEHACARFEGFDTILIDTAGRSPTDARRIEELARFAEASGADERHLVVSATSGERTIVRTAERFAPAGPDRLLLTKLDEADALGPLLSVTAKAGLPLRFVTTGQEVPDDLESARAERLARAVFEGLSPQRAERAPAQPAAREARRERANATPAPSAAEAPKKPPERVS